MGKSAHVAQRDKLVTHIMDNMKAYEAARETLAKDVWDRGPIEGLQAEGVKVIPAAELMFEARKIQNQNEVECLRIAAAIGGDARMQTIKEGNAVLRSSRIFK
jgi:Xaa-Pro aminopeptidase